MAIFNEEEYELFLTKIQELGADADNFLHSQRLNNGSYGVVITDKDAFGAWANQLLGVEEEEKETSQEEKDLQLADAPEVIKPKDPLEGYGTGFDYPMGKIDEPEKIGRIDEPLELKRDHVSRELKRQRNERPEENSLQEVDIDKTQLPKVTTQSTGFDYPMGRMEPYSPIRPGAGYNEDQQFPQQTDEEILRQQNIVPQNTGAGMIEQARYKGVGEQSTM